MRHLADFTEMRSFLNDFESDIDVCNVNNVESDPGDHGGMFISLICSHFVDRITVRTAFGLFVIY